MLSKAMNDADGSFGIRGAKAGMKESDLGSLGVDVVFVDGVVGVGKLAQKLFFL